MTLDIPPSEEELAVVAECVDRWLADALAGNPVVVAVDRGEPEPGDGARARWYVRVTGEEKAVFSVWFALRQRSLHFETYFMPAPEVNAADLYGHLLRRNANLRGISFGIGVEDAVFLSGSVDARWVDPTVLDHILGSLYAATELCFRPAMRLGFAGKFTG